MPLMDFNGFSKWCNWHVFNMILYCVFESYEWCFMVQCLRLPHADIFRTRPLRPNIMKNISFLYSIMNPSTVNQKHVIAYIAFMWKRSSNFGSWIVLLLFKTRTDRTYNTCPLEHFISCNRRIYTFRLQGMNIVD